MGCHRGRRDTSGTQRALIRKVRVQSGKRHNSIAKIGGV
jgi:hypothetical protein